MEDNIVIGFGKGKIAISDRNTGTSIFILNKDFEEVIELFNKERQK